VTVLLFVFGIKMPVMISSTELRGACETGMADAGGNATNGSTGNGDQ
jgi:hypothetical protein